MAATENINASITFCEAAIRNAVIFSVPNGNDPKKLITNPAENILSILFIFGFMKTYYWHAQINLAKLTVTL
jgi:hypothetical protein